jgi:hypothetical protein
MKTSDALLRAYFFWRTGRRCLRRRGVNHLQGAVSVDAWSPAWGRRPTSPGPRRPSAPVMCGAQADPVTVTTRPPPAAPKLPLCPRHRPPSSCRRLRRHEPNPRLTLRERGPQVIRRSLWWTTYEEHYGPAKWRCSSAVADRRGKGVRVNGFKVTLTQLPRPETGLQCNARRHAKPRAPQLVCARSHLIHTTN